MLKKFIRFNLNYLQPMHFRTGCFDFAISVVILGNFIEYVNLFCLQIFRENSMFRCLFYIRFDTTSKRCSDENDSRLAGTQRYGNYC